MAYSYGLYTYGRLVYGDSITEGVAVLGSSAKLDTNANDASLVYSYALARLLGRHFFS